MKGFGFYATAIVLLFNATAIAQTCAPGSTCISNAPATCSVDNETRYTVRGCRVNVTASWDGLSSPSQTGNCLATLPAEYMLLDLKETIYSDNNGSYSVSRFAKGIDFHYDEIVDQAYQSALDMAGKIVDPKQRTEAEAKIRQEWSRHKETIQNLKSNQDGVRIDASASPHGSAIDRKRGWIDVGVDLVVLCVAPINLKEQIFDKYKLDAVKGSLGREFTFENDLDDGVVLSTLAVDKYTNCSKTESNAAFSVVAGKSAIKLLGDPELEYCYRFSSQDTPEPANSDQCRLRAGDTATYSTAATECK